jgi:anaerobic selenocysteine-containing dehydrogenase
MKTAIAPQQTSARSEEVALKRGICGICPAGCWVKVGIENGRLVSIDADTGHPLGMICRRGKHAPEIIYSQHRLTHPQRRVGPKGKHEFEQISWDEAYDTIVERLNDIKRESGPEAVSIYTGRGAFEASLCDMFQPKGVAVSSASNLLFPFGSPNTMGVGALCYVSFAMIAPHVTMGRMLVNMFFDIENSEVLVVWGTNPATDSPPLDMHRLEAARERGARIVVIDPRHTETAKRTGAEWIPIRPGTDGALALAMIEVMVEEELYDESFAEEWCHGFDEVAEQITGVPADTIKNLARTICEAAGACPVMYTGLEYSDSGIQAIRAVLTLFALAGQLDVPGGIGLAMLNCRSCRVEGQVPDLQRLSRGIARKRARGCGAQGRAVSDQRLDHSGCVDSHVLARNIGLARNPLQARLLGLHRSAVHGRRGIRRHCPAGHDHVRE